VRAIRVEAARVGPDTLEVTGRLTDDRPRGAPGWTGTRDGTTVHDMTLTLRLRHPDLVVTHVGGSMATHPYVLCPDALPPLEQLVGISVARGFTRVVNERFGRQRGCAHLTALVHAMAPVVRQAAGAAFGGEHPLEAGGNPWFVNTCQAWREDGPLAERVRAGDVAGLAALGRGSAERPARAERGAPPPGPGPDRPDAARRSSPRGPGRAGTDRDRDLP
jgi:hypothetical protein